MTQPPQQPTGRHGVARHEQRPTSGQAVQAQPAQAQPAQAQPAEGQPVHGQPLHGQPLRGQPTVPQQRRAGQPHTPAEVRPAVAQPRFDLETTLSRPLPAVPWQATTSSTTATSTATSTETITAPGEAVTTRRAPAQAPGGPPPEVAHGPATAGEHQRRALSHRLPQLHIGWHGVSTVMLRSLSSGGGATGLMLGVDYQRRPVPIRFFRPEATRVTLVGGLWAQRILVFRALALGARVIVMTGDPRPWQGLGEWATGLADRMVLWSDPRPPEAPAGARQPLLILNDVGPTGIAPKPELGAWQTQVTVLRHLGAENAHTLQGCNLVMLQRLSRQEAAVAGSALNLTASGAGLLQEMTPEMLALMGSGANRYVWLAPTSVEQQYHGPPQR